MASAVQSVSRLSSVPGHTRAARTSYMRPRAAARVATIPASVFPKSCASSGIDFTTERTVSPSSKLPPAVIPNRAATIGAASAPTAASRDFGFQT